MGVLHRWKGALKPGTVAKIPKMVQMILRFIAKLLAEGHGQVSSMAPPSTDRELPDRCKGREGLLCAWGVGALGDF